MPASYLRALASPLAGAAPLLRPSRRWPMRSGEERPPAPAAAAPATSADRVQSKSAPSTQTSTAAEQPRPPQSRASDTAAEQPPPPQSRATEKRMPASESRRVAPNEPSVRSVRLRRSGTEIESVSLRNAPAPAVPNDVVSVSPSRIIAAEAPDGTAPSPIERTIQRRATADAQQARQAPAPATSKNDPKRAPPVATMLQSSRPRSDPASKETELSGEQIAPLTVAPATLKDAGRSGDALKLKPVRTEPIEMSQVRPQPPALPRPVHSGRQPEAPSIKIGTIEVRVSPPPVAPAAPVRARPAAAAKTGSPSLSRSLTSAFGLRQG